MKNTWNIINCETCKHKIFNNKFQLEVYGFKVKGDLEVANSVTLNDAGDDEDEL